jgi:hypothetical protein
MPPRYPLLTAVWGMAKERSSGTRREMPLEPDRKTARRNDTPGLDFPSRDFPIIAELA